MRELTMNEVQDVNGGLLGFVVVAVAALLGGCATMHPPGDKIREIDEPKEPVPTPSEV